MQRALFLLRGDRARKGPLVRAKIAQVSGDLGKIHMAASRFELSHKRYPVDLAEIGMDDLIDPWGNPYEYRVSGSSIEITSLGADGRQGGSGEDADVSN